jgi:protein TonB
MSTDGERRRPQSWEHLLEKDPDTGARFRLGITAALLIHAAIFAITWPTVAQAPPAEPEPVLIPFPITEFIPKPHEPEPILIEVPPPPVQGPPVISGPPDDPKPFIRQPVTAIEFPNVPFVIVDGPVDPPPPPVVEVKETFFVGVDIEAPRVIEKIEPRYTETARRAGIQGAVILDLIIDTAGRVESVTVLRGLPLGLTKSAVEAVEQWRFEASTYNNHPVSVRYILTVHFNLR